MFFNKKITSLVIAVLASSSIMFAQTFTTNSTTGQITLNYPNGKNFSISPPFSPSMTSPAIDMTQKEMKMVLYGTGTYGNVTGSQFKVLRYNGSYSWTSLFTINPDGKVGIGTDAPQANFHLKGNSVIFEGENAMSGTVPTNKFDLIIKSPGGGINDFVIGRYVRTDNYYGTLTPSFSMGYKNGAQLSFSQDAIHISKLENTTTNSQNMTVNNGLRISTTHLPTDYKLAVGGKIICEGIKVELQTNWPDYVFKADYQLKSLEDVEKHIEKEGHLPNIPSQEEVKENGVDLAEMQRLQMEKIEELTLYLIEQNKKMKALEIELETLKKK